MYIIFIYYIIYKFLLTNIILFIFPLPLNNYVVASADILYATDYPRKVVVASLTLASDSTKNGVFGNTREVVIKWTTLSEDEVIANCELGAISGIVRCFSAFSGNFNLMQLIPNVQEEGFYETFRTRVNTLVTRKNLRTTTLIDKKNLQIIRSRTPATTPQESVFFFERTQGTLDNDQLIKSIDSATIVPEVKGILKYLRRLGWRQGDVRLRNIHVAQDGKFLLGDLGKARRVSDDQVYTDEKMSLQREVERKLGIGSAEDDEVKPTVLRFD